MPSLKSTVYDSLCRLVPYLPARKVRRLHADTQLVADFMDPEVGRAYGVSARVKRGLLRQFRENTAVIPTGTSWHVHAVLAAELLTIPPEQKGVVIECGAYKGCSSASLSLVCAIVGRKLLVCDSFEGLPDDRGELHVYPHLKVSGYYEPGMYAGALEEVRGNIQARGRVDCCQFIKGYFCDTLGSVTEPIVMGFLDVDLASSTRDCIRHLWPLLLDGRRLYTDDSCDTQVVKLWFDDAWWGANMGMPAPGYVGSGCGLPMGLPYTSLGYAQKAADPQQSYSRIAWLRYPDQKVEAKA